jgi:hypothetical protein
MTRPAAARTSSKRSAPGARRPAARPPRRISGPVARARSGSLAAAVAIPVPGIALPRKRPSRSGAPSRRSAPAAQPGIAQLGAGALAGLSSSAFLDRLVRGRLWIGLLAFALIGIVAMQLLVLKLNTGVGRTLGHVAALQRENAQLSIEDSVFSSENRVAPLAASDGMTPAAPGTVHFLAASSADVSRAAAVLAAAAQASPSATSTTSAGGGESSTTTASTGAEAASQTTGGSAETASAAESSSSSATAATSGEDAAGSSESQPSGSSASGAPSNETTASPGQSAPSGEAQAAQASEPNSGAAASSPGSSASGAPSSGPGGGTQAGARE